MKSALHVLLAFGARPLAWGMVAAALLVLAGETRAQPVTLVQNGTPQMPLMAGSVPEPTAELQHYLEAITGTKLTVATPRAGRQGMYVGLTTDFPWLSVTNTAALGEEGFVLRSDGTNVILLAQHPPGVQHAVTTFLQSLGCRWFFPGQTWEVVPRRPTIQGAWDQRCVPSFKMQRKIWYGFGAYPPGARDLKAWERHNRMGGPVAISIGHTSHGLDFENDFAEHPDWFALVAGQRRPTKPCYSHPEVVARAIRHALSQAAGGIQMISMSPPDGLGYCECDRCFSVFQGATPHAQHGTFFARRPDGQLVSVTSETLFHFINQVAVALAKQHPETLIGCYAYSAYSHPPSFKLHPNVFVQTTTAFRRTDLTLEEQLEAWGALTPQLGVRDYYSVYQWDWDYPMPGKLAPDQLRQQLLFFHRKGVTSINAEASNNWGARGLGYYLAAHLMWDVHADVPELIRDFHETAFGPAGAVMERYYARWYGPSAASSSDGKPLPPPGTPGNDRVPAAFDLDTLKASFRDLDEAAGLLRDLPEHRSRVDQLRMYWHYLCLRHRLDQADALGDEDAILKAIEAEVTFGGRLAHLNVIHARPLLGKAFLRRFKKFKALLTDHPAVQRADRGWRRMGRPPAPEELEQLWQNDLAWVTSRSMP